MSVFNPKLIETFCQTTGIGKTIRNLSKQNGDTDIGKTAKLLCLEWKAAVKEEQEVHNEEDSYEEPVVKEEPNFDEPIESSASFDRIESIIKSELNRSDDEEVDRSVSCEVDRSVSSESDRHSNSEKRRHNNEDSKSDKKHKKHKSSHKSRESESTVSSKTEFETLLGLNDQIIKNNKKSPNKRSDSDKNWKKSNNVNNTYDKSYVKTETIESINYLPNGLKRESDSKQGIKGIESEILSSLPTAHYRPLPNRDLIDERIEANRKKVLKTNEDLSVNVQSKKGRTAVFAGHARAKTYTHVPRLEDLCIQVLMDNYDKLLYLADAPYYLLKPVLQKCNPKQLAKLEKFNPVSDTNDSFLDLFL